MKDNKSIQWQHSHNFGVDNKHNANKVKKVFWLTTIVMVLEISAGIWSGSMALLADGWHMGTHSAAFLITMFTYAYAKKHANNQAFSFGTGKVNYLGGFTSAIALGIVALLMVVESVHRILEPQPILFNQAIAVTIIGLAVNVVSVFVLHDDHHHDHHHKHSDKHTHDHHHDHNLKAAYFHVLADTLTSLLAIVALLAGKYFGLIWMDALVGIIGAIVIARWSYGLMKESSEVLLDKSDDKSALKTIVEVINAEKGVTIRDIHLWRIAPAHQALILSLEIKNTDTLSDYKLKIQKILPEISHITLEVSKV
ncbi:CDF family Co(II)/Ni(II) efflux transporter DmeF [Thalassotalea profundi]|uniref:Transporter n=1 Tax=Thalassotalea profundi TaxID=2036687 RepID=A0ABQ3IRZ9_9GAMM|nr:CDF family Co(II)/Ni(II) efflux transporter DmeF [Thalassotalea profundi]GHE88207.1 transporter [Thalassotalea profundi]